MARRLTQHKDLAQLINKAEAQGFQVTARKAGHLHWRAPDGAIDFTGSTPSDYRSVNNQLAWLKRHGFIVENRPRTERRQRERPAAAPQVQPEPPSLVERWCKGMRWTYAQAVDLLRQGYTIDYVVKRTNWGPGWFGF